MHKRTAIVSAVSLAVAGGLSAAAFITTSSQSFGHAAQGTHAPSIQTTVSVPVVEFGLSGNVRISVQNTSVGGQSVNPTHVVVTPPVVTPTGDNTCPDGSFTVSDFVVALPPSPLTPGQSWTIATEKLNFVDLPSDQSGCLGADVRIGATVS